MIALQSSNRRLPPLQAPEALWPALPLAAWRDTYATLHMWLQIVGKVRLALVPLVNHWWNAALYVTTRGLSTGAMPCGPRTVEVRFDFLEHDLIVETSDGQRKVLPLLPRSVADFYREFTAALQALDVAAPIWPKPVEVSTPIPFGDDHQHAAYDPVYAQYFWQILCNTAEIFQEFRGPFLGKCSPVHFFWGSCDLAVTRFNGQRAPDRPGADRITREAYSHACISHGFWPGGNWFGTEIASPIYYSYTVPEPAALREQAVQPAGATFDPKLGEFTLPYDEVRQSAAPRQALLDFLQSTYEAGANCARWDRAALERR